MNYRPFGTGIFGDKKRRLLNVFLEVEKPDGKYFTKYGPLIARDIGFPWGTYSQKLAVWDYLATLASCNQALEFPKLGRWFSWNGAAHVQIQEFHSVKMLFEWHLQDEGVPDPDEAGAAFDDLSPTTSARTHQQQLAQLKASAGGFKLSYMMMSSALLDMTKIMYVVTRACWSWYTWHVQNCRTPRDNLMHAKRMADGGWCRDQHFADTIRCSLYNPNDLDYMLTPAARGASTRVYASRVVDLMWRLLSDRVWSMAARYSAPPESYAKVLSANPIEREAAANRMRHDWKCLLLLEQRVAQSPVGRAAASTRGQQPATRRLLSDVPVARSAPLRALFSFYERDKFRPDSVAGGKLLQGFLLVPVCLAGIDNVSGNVIVLIVQMVCCTRDLLFNVTTMSSVSFAFFITYCYQLACRRGYQTTRSWRTSTTTSGGMLRARRTQYCAPSVCRIW